MKRLIGLTARIAIAALALAAASGCSSLQSPGRASDVERRMKRDLVKFYEKQGYSYFLLGYEYYGLAKEAEDSHAPASRVKDYRAKARLYYGFSQDLQNSATELRRELGEEQSLTPASEPTPPMPGGAGAPAPGQPTAPPAGTPAPSSDPSAPMPELQGPPPELR